MKEKFLNSRPVKFFLALSLKKKILFSVVSVFILADVLAIFLILSGTSYSRALLCIDENIESSRKMIASNGFAESCSLDAGHYAFFRFSRFQKDEIKKALQKYGSLSFSCEVEIPFDVSDSKKREKLNEKQLDFYFGLLYGKDFGKNGKPCEDLSERILSGTDLRNFIPQENIKTSVEFETALAIGKNPEQDEIPEGFFVYSEKKLKINYASVTKPCVGFDLTRKVPFYALPSNGGAFVKYPSEFDFTGASLVFSVSNSEKSLMPSLFIKTEKKNPVFEENKAEDEENPYPEPDSIEIDAGGKKLTVYETPGDSETAVLTELLSSPFSMWEVENGNLYVSKLLMEGQEKSLLPVNGYALNAMKTDPGLIPVSSADNWRCSDYELYAWDKFPEILVFDTKNYAVQSRFFTRLAFFVEKEGYKGKLLTNDEIGDMHGYNAHDYSAESLARFFTKAFETGFVLNREEEVLREILLRNGVIAQTEKGFEPLKGAVISISQESRVWLRQSLSAHEMWHGIFFTDEDFRNTVAAVYFTVDRNTMDFIKGYWKSQTQLGYDQNDEYLMHNEFMAYLMQQNLKNTSVYFVHCANRGSVMEAIPELCDWVRRTEGKTFEDAGRVFDTYVQDRWGLDSGRVGLVVRKF